LGVRHLFQGQLWTQETELNDYRNRVELPAMGVFLQPDPIGFKGDAANIYRFCNNNAVNRIDPLGLESDGYLHLTPAELHWLGQARANIEHPGRETVEIWKNTFVTKPTTRMQAVIARGNQRKLSDIKEGHLEQRIVGNTKTWVQLEELKLPAGWRAVVVTHKHWNHTGYGAAGWSGNDRATARDRTMVERTDETQPGVFKRLVPRTDGSGRYKEENFNHPIGERGASSNSGGPGSSGGSFGGSGTSSGPTAAQVDAANQAIGVPSLGAESVNYVNGKL
jgi:RHS repeat-associated protein